MKARSGIILLAALLFGTAGKAQAPDEDHPHKPSHTYVRVGLGYGFTFGGQSQMNGVGINGSETLSGSTTSMDQKNASFGSGVAAQVAAGYMINRNFGFELGVHAIVAPTAYTFEGPVPLYSGTRLFRSETRANLPVYVIPALVFKTDGQKIQLHARTGLVLPLSNKMEQTEAREPASGVPPGQSTEVFTREITNRFSLGLQGAVGLSYLLNTHLSVSAELNGISRTAYAKRRELVAYTENGLDALPALSTNQIVTEYSNSYDVTEPVSATQPASQPTYSIPFSSLGLQVGIKYHF